MNGDKEQISLMFENEVLPAVEQAVEMDVLQIKKYRNEHKLGKLEIIFKQNNSLARCLEAGLTDSELLLILLVSERQKIVDMADLYQQCHQVINEEYLQFTSRMVRVTIVSILRVHLKRQIYVNVEIIDYYSYIYNNLQTKM